MFSINSRARLRRKVLKSINKRGKHTQTVIYVWWKIINNLNKLALVSNHLETERGRTRESVKLNVGWKIEPRIRMFFCLKCLTNETVHIISTEFFLKLIFSSNLIFSVCCLWYFNFLTPANILSLSCYWTEWNMSSSMDSPLIRWKMLGQRQSKNEWKLYDSCAT